MNTITELLPHNAEREYPEDMHGFAREETTVRAADIRVGVIQPRALCQACVRGSKGDLTIWG